MTKRIISVFLIIFVFVLNCVPVFAWQDSDFLFTGNETIPTELVNFMTENPGYNYYYVFGRRNGSNFKILLYSVSDFSVSPNKEKDYLLTYTNNTGDQISVHSTLSDFGKLLEPYQVLDFDYGGDRCYYWVEYMVSKNNNCVNSRFCSPDVYVEENPDDYEEDGVVIKGLTGFFNKMTSVLNDILETIKNIVDSIIGIPEDGYFESKINSIKESINAKYNLDSLFGFFEDMKNISATSPDISFDKDLNINGTTLPFDFYVDFSWFDGEIKKVLFLLLRAVGYPLLIIYNLNQVYLLFRGRKFFENDGGEDA